MVESTEALLVILLRDFFFTGFGGTTLSADETSGSGSCALSDLSYVFKVHIYLCVTFDRVNHALARNSIVLILFHSRSKIDNVRIAVRKLLIVHVSDPGAKRVRLNLLSLSSLFLLGVTHELL